MAIEPAFFLIAFFFITLILLVHSAAGLFAIFTASLIFLTFNKLPPFPCDPIKSLMPFQYTRTVQHFTEKNTYRCITPFLLLGGTQFLPPTWIDLFSLSGVLECPVHQGCPFHGIRYTSNKKCEK
jgi:hypothetical protein